MCQEQGLRQSGDPRLRSATRDIIDELWRAGGSVLVSSALWEVALMADTGRISLDRPPEA